MTDALWVRSLCHRHEIEGGREVLMIQRRYGSEKNGYDYWFGYPIKKPDL